MEITTNDDATAGSRPPFWFQILSVALVAAVYFSGLGAPLMGPDEPRYAQVAREMYQRGDWLTPTLAGHPWFEKPPLLYWLEIASYHLFGVNEFASRLGPALCGLGIIAALWVLARGEGKASGGLLALMTAATGGLIAFSHAAGVDVVLTLTITCAFVSFWKFERNGHGGNLALFYVFVGLAVLAKGLVGLLFPFASIFLFYVVSRRMPQRQILLSLLWGLPLVLLIAAPWHVAMYLRHGSEFIDVYFIEHHFERFTTNRFLHPQPFYFYWWVLPLLALPWTLFAFVQGVNVVRKSVIGAAPILLFSLCWLAVPLVFFSFSGSKLPGYILPAVPPLVIIAWYWVRGDRAIRSTAVAISIFVLSLSIALIVAYLPSYAARDSVKGLIAAADSRGYATSRVLTLYMISHNAEFYAGERLLRDANGEQVMLEGAQLVLDEIEKDGRPVLVLVPVEYAAQLTDYSKVRAEVLGDNGRVAIVAVAAR